MAHLVDLGGYLPCGCAYFSCGYAYLSWICLLSGWTCLLFSLTCLPVVELPTYANFVVMDMPTFFVNVIYFEI